MNSNELYTGEFYAWFPNRPKGRIPLGAAKVTVDHIVRSKSTWEKNRRTEVTITVVEKGSRVSWYDVGSKVTVPARELIDYWNEYKDEVAHLEAEQQRREYERKKIGSRRRALTTLIGRRMEPLGLPKDAVSVESNYAASVELDPLLEWLRITEEDIESTVLEDIGPPPEQLTTGYTTD